MPNDNDWVEVASATTNTMEGSNVDVFLSMDGPLICPSMSDADFRRSVMKLTAKAVELIGKRLHELEQWTPDARGRVSDWFGTNEEATRALLRSRLPALRSVLFALGPKNFLRASPELDGHLGCLPNNKNVTQELAHVCAPNTATHTICISPKFCITRPVNMFGESQIATIIHEASHFADTFASKDNMYGMNAYLTIWAKTNASLALDNADNIAGYVVYGEDIHVN